MIFNKDNVKQQYGGILIEDAQGNSVLFSAYDLIVILKRCIKKQVTYIEKKGVSKISFQHCGFTRNHNL